MTFCVLQALTERDWRWSGVTGFRRGASVLLGGQGLGGLVWLQFDSYWPAKSQAQMARTPLSYCPHGGTITSLLTDAERATLACQHFLALVRRRAATALPANWYTRPSGAAEFSLWCASQMRRRNWPPNRLLFGQCDVFTDNESDMFGVWVWMRRGRERWARGAWRETCDLDELRPCSSCRRRNELW